MARLFPFIIFLFSGVYLTSGYQYATLNDDNAGLDINDLRVSSHNLQGPTLNYPNIFSGETRRSGSEADVYSNQIGKPLVPLPPINRSQGNRQRNNGQLHSSEFLSPRKSNSRQQQQQQQQQQRQQQIQQQQFAKYLQSSRTPMAPSLLLRNTMSGHRQCRWLTLREFKGISLDDSELIIKDADDQPSYILTMRAYIKWTDENYFPLNNLKSLPHASKIVFDEPSDGASVHHKLDCSFMANSGNGNSTGGSTITGNSNIGQGTTATLELPLQQLQRVPSRPFREEIRIQVDCGYLILHTQSDGAHLTLRAISFLYQNSTDNPNVSAAYGGKQMRGRPLPISRTMPQGAQFSEHLIFTTEGTKNYPLFTMPLISHYICRNRVVLTGNNSAQIVLDRFELMRITYPKSAWEQDRRVSALDHHRKFINDEVDARPRIRLARDLATVQRDPYAMVTRCPEPSSMFTPLTSMMDFSLDKTNYTVMGTSMANRRWTHNLNHATNVRSNQLSFIVVTINCILIYYLKITLTSSSTV